MKKIIKSLSEKYNKNEKLISEMILSSKELGYNNIESVILIEEFYTLNNDDKLTTIEQKNIEKYSNIQ